MNTDGVFQLRQLHETDLEQFNTLLRYAFQVTQDELIKTGWQDEEIKRAKSPILQNAYVLGWFFKNSLASQLAIYPMKVNVYGEIYDMGGITAVTTYPEYAGRGLSHSLIRESLKYMKEKEQTLSFLYPYSIPFYRRKGWEIVSDQLTFTIRDSQLPKKQEVSGMVRRLDWEHEDFKNVYKYFAMQKHGALIRNDLAWDEYFRWDTDDTTVAVYYTEEQRPLGYLVYTIENEIFHVKEMIYLNLEAKNGLWNYISSHYSMITTVKGNNFTGEPLGFLLEDSEITETIAPYIMARIVDVKGFLLQYPFQSFPEDLHILFRIHDGMASWNEGDFILYQEGKKTFCERVTDAPQANIVELNIRTMTAMFMGYKRPSYLYENDRITMEYYMIQVLEQLIPMGKPYFSDYF